MTKLQAPPDTYSPGWLSTLDGRTGIAQTMRSRYAAMTSDLGGAESLSYAQRSLVERALWLEYWLQQQEVELAEGKEFDVSRWIQAANGLQGILAKLGLERKARDVPSLADYLAARESHA
ncbi:hypothetical protein HNO51_12485 [Billgrantia sulfidoxydans]|uniref:Uncharacterized protein n=1 Tax=Billgrantia sulfidoxydans TaxID=2733484 RepID=A0ABX7W594_9GAMM|nr:hypothetical protein [Halomonas sulfidoxydans]QTP55426.1 hypothetical protein HNO51_12485 [Halomonas sulfidoxydans]